VITGLIISGLLLFSPVYAEEFSTTDNTYKLQIDDAGLGYQNGESHSVDSTNSYLLSGTLETFDVGEGNATGSTAGNYRMKTGLQPTFEAEVPEITTLSSTDSGISLYDRLLLTLDPNGNPTSADGTLFAVQISTTSDFSSYNYINPTTFQPDTVTNSDLSVYFTACAQTSNPGADESRWDCGHVGGLKRYLKGLNPSTTYFVRAVAMNGNFTNSQPGPLQSATTSAMVLTLQLSSLSSSFGSFLLNSVTTSSPSTVVTTTTNAQNGYLLQVNGQGDGSTATSGLYSVQNSKMIASVSGNLDAQLSQEGYGLQASITAGTQTLNTLWDGTQPGRNTSYVGQITRSAQTLTAKSSPSLTSGDTCSLAYKATISASTPAGNDYTDRLTFTLRGDF
jgi:hypothetical protein